MERDMVRDQHNRTFKSLRVSITGDCNLACTYCDPSHRCEPEHNNELSAEKIVQLVKWLVDVAGIKKVRLTGGEPLITPKIEYILPEMNRLAIEDLGITTNGQLLSEKVDFLKQNGIKRLNISLDTLDPQRYLSITGGGDIQRTLAGIEEALSSKVKVKVNMVPVKGLNDTEILRMLDYCLERGIELRYIELMQMGHLKKREKYENKLITMHQIFDSIQQKYKFEQIPTACDSTAKRYHIKEMGDFGIIANDSAPFCRHCNRLRLSSEGFLYGCLSSSKKFDIKPLLHLNPEDAKSKLHSILNTAILTKQDFAFNGSSVLMRSVGG